MPFLLRALALLLALSPLTLAAAPSDEAMIAQFRARRADWERLREYLVQTNTKVAGPGYGAYLELRKSLGAKRFYVTDRGQTAFRFPTYLLTGWTQFTPGSSKGYAWLPPTPGFPNYPGAKYQVDPEEPPTTWRILPSLDRAGLPFGKGNYTVAIRRIEGDWYLYVDNNPYRHSW